MKHLAIVLAVLLTCSLIIVEGHCRSLEHSDSTSIAGTITGSASVCKGMTGVTYTVTGSSATSGYTWTVPSGVTVTSGAGSNVITVSFAGASSGMNQMFSVTGNSLSASLAVSVYVSSATTPIISGAAAACPNQTGVVYTISNTGAITNGFNTSFGWVAPGGASIASSSSSSATVNFSSSFTGAQGPLMFYMIYGPCGTGPTATKSIGLTTTPAQPAAINGTTVVSPGFLGVSYNVPALANTTSYQWNLPAGVTIASGSGTNNITVDYSSTFSGGNITVQGVNGTCIGPASASLQITLAGYPSAAGSISGNSSPCIGTSGTTITYTVSPISGATSYIWGIPGGATGTSTTNSINVTFPPDIPGNSVTISVAGVNSSGTGLPSFLNVTLYKPLGQLGAISGNNVVCPGLNNVVYTVAPVTNAVSYQWGVPTGSTLVSGQGTSTLTVNYSTSFTGGNIYVVALAGPCGGTNTSILAITIPPALPATASAITGTFVVCQGNTGVVYSVAPITNATGYVWSLPTGCTIVSGQNTNSITVNYSASAVTGNISVYGTNCSGNGASFSQQVVVSTLSGAAGSISGNATPCLGDAVVNYSVLPITNATGYTWSLPSGATIVSGQNTNAITVNYSLAAIPGNVTVQGINCKGSGTASTVAITYSTASLGNIGTQRTEPQVDLVTGTMSTSIPLFNIKNGDVQVGGALSYFGSGVRVVDDDGWVGQNWGLSVQSYKITREMRGLPDDYTATAPDNRKGWLINGIATTVKNFTPAADGNTSICSDEVADWTTLNGIDYNQDTEPDAFFVNAPGLSFQFYFDENKLPHALPFQDVIITPSPTNAPITSFTIRDSRGYVYTFAETESITEYVSVPNAFYLVRQTNQLKTSLTYTTSWRLTSITAPIYGTVNFTYRGVLVNDPNLYPDWYKATSQYKYRYQVNFKTLGNGYLGTATSYAGFPSNINHIRNSTIKVLQTISSTSMDVIFSSAPKNVGTTMERLNSITVYDKRDGTSKLVNTISLAYTPSGDDQRALLTKVRQSSGCLDLDYSLEYYNPPLPKYIDYIKDQWGFYNQPPYDQNVVTGMLKKITYPYKGFDAFFYESHDYWDGTVSIQSGGVRLRKMISYDGVSSNNDQVKEYYYKAATGQTSGKLQYKALHDFSVTKLDNFKNSTHTDSNLRYLYAQQNYGLSLSDLNKVFTVHTDEELSHYGMFNGSIVAYERVTVKETDAGQSVYEFDLPASYGDVTANNGEWNASNVLVARPSTGGSSCYELANIQIGMNQYPFPPNPVYDFAKGLLKKVTNYKDDGSIVRDMVYSYQRVYKNGSSIKKIYGLALEELPTYYYNGTSYVDNKLFLYSRYEIFTEVKTEVNSQVETIYNSTDLLKKTVTTTNFYYDNQAHGELTRIETTNSDGSLFRKRIKYAKDFTISSPSDVPSAALVNLIAPTTNRNSVVETTSSRTTAGVEMYLNASLTTYQTISGKVYPFKAYTFNAPEGATAFTPSSVSGGTTFQFDQTNYVLDNTYLSFDSYGNAAEIVGRNKVTNSIAYGYSGEIPIISINNTKLSEMRYSDFETSTPVDFTVGWSSTSGIGRSNSKGLNFPAGTSSTNFISNTLTNTNSKYCYFSFWLKAATAGNVSLQVGATTTLTYPFTTSSGFQYYKFKVPVASIVGTSPSYAIKIWTSVATVIDEIAYYPEQSDFVANMYLIPNGKISDTDSNGISNFYDYDVWGRLKVIYDRNRNVLKKFDYQVRP